MTRFLIICLGLCTCISASAAGLGFNPFDKGSPTSPTGSQNSRPAGPSAAPAAAKPTPAPVAAPATKPDAPASSKQAQPAKK